jgi:hypothetical protein
MKESTGKGPSLVTASDGKGPVFASAEQMSVYQQERELEEALRVRAMTPAERSRWFKNTWGALQRQAPSLPALPPAVRHYATLEEKNRFEEEREIELAVQLALQRGQRGGSES